MSRDTRNVGLAFLVSFLIVVSAAHVPYLFL